MFKLRGCPRCQGDLYMDRNELDDDGVHCLQCGYRKFVGTSAFDITRPWISVPMPSEPALAKAA